MCNLNFIYCYKCFNRVGKFEASLCPLPDLCPLNQFIHFDPNYECGWCVYFKVKHGYSERKRCFFKMLADLQRRPGSLVEIHQQMKNLFYDASVVDLYLASSLDEVIEEPFCFTLFDREPRNRLA